MTTIAPEPHYAHKDGVIYYARKFRMSRSVALVVLDNWRKEYRRAFNAHDMQAASAAIHASNDLAAALEEQARWVRA